jgi:hypothetical protein
METIKLKTHIGQDGILRLELPEHIRNRDIEILVVLQPVQNEPVDAMGYPIGYFDETYGSMADNPIERGEQPPVGIRDEITQHRKNE